MFFILPIFIITGEIDGEAAAKIALPGILTLVVLLALLAALDRLVSYISANAPSDNNEGSASNPPNAAALGLYFGCVLLGGLGLVLYFQEHPIVADLIAYDLSGQRPGFLLIGLPVLLLLGYARWIDNRPS
ncbi:hypothetical protein [Qipengyuania huizhouensis]|uniref:hypothetical protein n=1 Tax=Qipengyuania huizhouensis TaxID=2867245 RepID=UPI00180192E8|nr:hypothetical protein [Qipengyuania huizhouensis]MBA4765973.1 hypothetical protein [Erythrobacter sp.]